MSDIPIALIKELRDRTESSYRLCKLALKHENCDLEAAKNYLRVLNQKNDELFESQLLEKARKREVMIEKARFEQLPFHRRLLLFIRKPLIVRYFAPESSDEKRQALSGLTESWGVIKSTWITILIMLFLTLVAIDFLRSASWDNDKIVGAIGLPIILGLFISEAITLKR